MKILLLSHYFSPHVGGLETVAMLLAEEFVARGHEVRVITQSPSVIDGASSGNQNECPFRVYRNPSPYKLLQLTRWCDIFFQNNVSLRSLWPLLFVRRAWVVAQQTWLTRVGGRIGWQDHLKLGLLPLSTVGISSKALTKQLRAPYRVVGNPYRSALFKVHHDVPRDQPLIFVGRLVSEKGVDLLLEALSLLKTKYALMPSLTVVGDGPERTALEALARQMDVETQVNFVGQKAGEELVRLLNHHQVIVVPSRIEEPFGIVALEGIACGCVAIGSAGGGLRDAIGPCGLLFPNQDAPALALSIQRVLGDDSLRQQLRADASAHLARYSSHQIAEAYLQLFRSASRTQKP